MTVITTIAGAPVLLAGDPPPCCEGETLTAWPYDGAGRFCPACGQLYAVSGEPVDA